MEARLEELRKEDAPDEKDRKTGDEEPENDEEQSGAARHRARSEPGEHFILRPPSSVF
jgi:hypothetical protein